MPAGDVVSKDRPDVEKRSVEESVVEKKSKKVPPVLKIEKIEEVGEKSPQPQTVYELFKRYNSKAAEKKAILKKAKEETRMKEAKAENGVNVEFDQLSTDEKSGFLKKLKMLSVDNVKEKLKVKQVGEEIATPVSKKFSRRSQGKSREGSGQKSEESERSGKKPTYKSLDRKKEASRRLIFPAPNGESETTSTKSEMVAAMTKEYERIVLGRNTGSVPISRPYRHGGPRGSLETPVNSPAKSSFSPNSSPEKNDEPSRLLSIDDDVNVKKSRSSIRHFSIQDEPSQARWTGELPPRDYTSPIFSRKIFVGGVPWDITEGALKDSFGEFGTCSVEWPGQEARYRGGHHPGSFSGNFRSGSKMNNQSATGYVYMIFEDERAVAKLLHECSQEIGGAGEWYFKIRAQRSKSTEIRQVQIIPWVTSDSLYCENMLVLESGTEPKRTVFVGALHGMMTAQVLHNIMEDCFGTVECVQLDTDKFKYPIGSGRVTFCDHGAYFKAIEFGYLIVHTSKFKKRVQIDPFLESTACMVCNSETAHCFCRNRDCFKYYCNTCWAQDHKDDSPHNVHIPVIVPSSATKAYSSSTRRSTSHIIATSPDKSVANPSISAPNQSQPQYQHNGNFVKHYFATAISAVPMIAGQPAMSPVYAYVAGGVQSSPSVFSEQTSSAASQSCDSNLCSPIDFSTGGRRHSRSLSTNSYNQFYVNSPGMLTPTKFTVSPNDQVFSGYYGNGPSVSQAAFLPPPVFFAPNGSGQITPTTTAAPFYGGNMYYGYIPQPVQTSQMVYEPNNVMFHSQMYPN